MILKSITPPEIEPIGLEEVQGQARISDLSNEALTVGLFISAVRQEAESVTRRALITQEWELILDSFPAALHPLRLPLPPLQSVSSITYVDTLGAQQTMDPSKYQVVAESVPAYIVPAYGSNWPETLNQPASVRVRFVCGYGDTADTVPAAIRQWMLVNVSNLYENRESETVASGRLTMVDLSTFCNSLIDDFRVPRF